MKSFFGAIQHWFSGDLYGRHLGLILQEIGVRQPKALTSFISDACGIPHKDLKNVRFQAEYTFQGKRGKRRADLAVLLEDEDEPIVLIEIKYHDKPLPETETKPAQLDDYRTWRDAEKERRHVLLLSRELFASPGLEVRRWNVLARHLRPYAERSDLVDMLVKYLEEEGNVMQDINGASLTKYIKRYLCHRKQGANNVDGPVEFSNLLKNIRLMSGTFHGHFKGAWRDAGMKIEGESYDKTSKVASIDFDVWNRLKAGADGKAIVDADGGLRNELKDGGTIDVYAKHSFGHAQNWLRVGYGITFVVSSEDNMDTPPEAFLFASVNGAAFERAGITVCQRRFKTDTVFVVPAI